MRFHQAVAFLPTADLVALAVASDELGFDGIYLSDHLFNPRDLRSRYTYSTAPDGSPPWPKETEWPDPMTLIAYLAGRTGRLLFTTGIYVAPVRDLVTVAKSVGTAAVVSRGRVRLGVGSGWCEEEFDATGQDFHNRGRRLDEMIGALRALWSGGWVEHHGTYYDIPPCQMSPSPPSPVPIYGGGGSDAAIKRATEHCDGWLTPGTRGPDAAMEQFREVRKALERAGRGNDPFDIYLAIQAPPDVDLYLRFEDAGVTDLICAPWMAARVDPSDTPEVRTAKRVEASERFATEILAKMQ